MIDVLDLSAFREYLRLNYQNKNTARQYWGVANRYSSVCDDISQDQVNRFLQSYGNHGVNRASLKALLECYGLRDVRVPKVRSRPRKKAHKFISKEQVDYIIDNVPSKMALLVRLYFETGLRLVELLRINRADVNIKDRSMRGIGKGNKEFEVYYSKDSARLLYHFLSFEGAEYPFTYHDVVNPDKKFWRELKLECRNIGLPNVTPHKLRHAMGHFLKTKKNWDLEQIRVKLRHESIGTTQIYATETAERIRKKMDDEVFNGD